MRLIHNIDNHNNHYGLSLTINPGVLFYYAIIYPHVISATHLSGNAHDVDISTAWLLQAYTKLIVG